MNRFGYGLTFAALILAGCHTITEELPTKPSEPPKAPASGVLKVSIPVLPTPTPPPAPKPNPTPTPAPGPTPAPAPTAQPPGDTGGCGQPLPPSISRMGAKIHIRGPNKYTLDVTPQVHDYNPTILGLGGVSPRRGRLSPPPDRFACEIYAIGYAEDTKRPGPTWKRNGRYCTGQAGDCENHEENQFLLYAMGSGYYEACTDDGVCGGVQVDR